MGREPGVKEICDELNFRHIPDIEYTEQGTPLLNSMMDRAEEEASNHILLLISSDVVLTKDPTPAVQAVANQLKNFCGVSRKLQQRTVEPLDFSQDWRSKVKEGLRWNLITSGDFFLYTKGFWGTIPEFVIGRTCCDNWLFFEAATKECLVDMTKAVEIIDFQHSYAHCPKGWQQEKMQNFILNEGKTADFRDANWELNETLQLVRRVT